MTQVFISYKSEYRVQALKLRDSLNTWGYATWLDVDNIPTGAYFRHEIDKGLRESQIVVGVMTPEAFASRDVMWEWDYGLYNSRLIPLKYFAGQDDSIPYHLRGTQYIDFSANEDRAFTELQAILTAPPAPSTSPPKPETRQPEATTTQQTNRQVMLQKVHDYWIGGVLEKAEHNPLIDLELAAPEKVLRHPEYGNYGLPADADILTLYGDLQRELLILGAPGAGKTTLMLQLARELLTEATANEKQPIPVVFNLSSWATKREPLADWLKDRLWQEYQVPKKVAARWVDDGAILPLLDGLDEVAEAHRNECVEAINTFRKSHPFVDLVVCSRIEEYTELTKRLHLTAIQLQALSPEQIDAYVQGDDLTGLQALIANDAVVREMATTPFLLNTLVYSYAGLSANALSGPDTLAKRRDHLFNLYAEKRFAETTSDYTQRDTRHYLTFLATKLVQHDLIVFYIENLQSTLLQKGRESRIYRLVYPLLVGLLGGLLVALVFGLLGGRGVDKGIHLVETVSVNFSALRRGLVVGLLVALLGGLVYVTVYGRVVGLVPALVVGLVIALNEGIQVSQNVQQRIQPNAGIWRSAQHSLRIGFVLGLVALLPGFLLGGLEQGLCLNDGSNTCSIDALLRWTLSWTTVAVALLVGAPAALAGWLAYGGRAIILQNTVRLLLMRRGDIPWNYAKFLDYAAAIGLLRKVGSGYIFVHRYLLEYFAGLDE